MLPYLIELLRDRFHALRLAPHVVAHTLHDHWPGRLGGRLLKFWVTLRSGARVAFHCSRRSCRPVDGGSNLDQRGQHADLPPVQQACSARLTQFLRRWQMNASPGPSRRPCRQPEPDFVATHKPWRPGWVVARVNGFAGCFESCRLKRSAQRFEVGLIVILGPKS